ncbi:MAG: hypothetical protein IJP92_18120 [Lachnospiraceae bacterium]|nr:hypothetical protein [Lachnospiraceae bacterium]
MFLILYLLLFAIVAVSVAFVQPIDNTPPWFENPPDEHARFRIPLFIARYGHLPVGTEPEMANLYGGLYAMRPSLGLYVMALLLRLLISFGADGFALVFAARLVNVTCGICMAYVVYRLSKLLFAREEIRLLFCCMVMYLPQHLFLHTYVNNESMNLLSVAMMLYAVTVLYREGFSARICILLTAAWIMCILTNFNAYAFVLCTGILFLARFIGGSAGERHFDTKRFLRFGLPVILAVLIGTGWWFVRMYLLWDGDIFGLRATEAFHETVGVMQIGNDASTPGEALSLFLENNGPGILARSFVALYGSMSLAAPEWYYICYGLFLLPGMLAGCAALVPGIRKADARQRFFWLLIFAACMITIVLWIRYVLYTDFQPQARYIMPMLIPLYVFMVRGWEYLAEKLRQRKALCYLPQAATAVAVLALLYYVYRVAFRYYLDF